MPFNEPQTIHFPEGVRTLSLGRNGGITTVGLILDEESRGIALKPCRTNGVAGRCQLRVPADPATLCAIGDAFIAGELTSRPPRLP